MSIKPVEKKLLEVFVTPSGCNAALRTDVMAMAEEILSHRAALQSHPTDAVSREGWLSEQTIRDALEGRVCAVDESDVVALDCAEFDALCRMALSALASPQPAQEGVREAADSLAEAARAFARSKTLRAFEKFGRLAEALEAYDKAALSAPKSPAEAACEVCGEGRAHVWHDLPVGAGGHPYQPQAPSGGEPVVDPKCPKCNGTATQEEFPEINPDPYVEGPTETKLVPCSYCHGSGKVSALKRATYLARGGEAPPQRRGFA